MKQTRVLTVGLAGVAAAWPGWLMSQSVDFRSEVKPIIEAACVHCHGESKQKGDYRIDTKDEALKAIDGKLMIVPGKPESSPVYSSLILEPDHDDIMPPKSDGPPLSKAQSEVIKAWISAGAKWPQGVVLEQKPRIDFVQHIQPLLERHCVSCHGPEKPKGEYDLATRELAFKGGEVKGTAIVAFQPEKSPLYTLMALPADDDDVMPPKKNGGPLPKEELEKVRLWIAQGAVWPEGLPPLHQREATQSDRPPNPDDLELVKKIHSTIIAKSAEKSESDMREYQNVVPRTGARYIMVPSKADHLSWEARRPRPATNRTRRRKSKSASNHSGWGNSKCRGTNTCRSR